MGGTSFEASFRESAAAISTGTGHRFDRESKYRGSVRNGMRVRRIVPGDELVVLRAAHLFSENPELAAVRAYLLDDRNLLLFAFEGSDAVGVVRGTELQQLKSRRKQMFLYEIMVDTPSRGRGIGTALVKALLQDCRERGFEEVFVLTDPANEVAVRLFRSTGALTETPADRMFVYPLHSGLEPPV